MLERLRKDQGPEQELQGVVKNLTPEGMLLEANVPLNKSELLQLSFTLPNTQTTLNVEARVCWSEHKKAWSTAGLEFMNVDPDQHEAIMEYLMNLGPNILL
jgi:c-di-GMP-binding flagellar brake protein YcgR